MFGPQQNDPFNAIDGADATGQRNPYLLRGQYLLRIVQCKSFESRQRKLFYLVELDVVQSDNHDRPEGMRVSWMTNLGLDMGPINVKRFLGAAMGMDPSDPKVNQEINSDVARMSVDDTQPLHGTLIYAQCSDITTKAGTPFLDVRWAPVAQGDAVAAAG